MAVKYRKHSQSLFDYRTTLFLVAMNIGIFWYLNYVNPLAGVAVDFSCTPLNLFINRNIACLVVSGFLHANIKHVLLNSLGILVFGSIVEKRFGSGKTFVIYFSSLILSMLFAMIIYTFIMHRNVSIIGASGAVMGLVSCAMLADPFVVTYETFLPIPVMIKGWMFIYADLKGLLGGERTGISHITHLMGFLSIAVIVYFLNEKERQHLNKGLAINIFSVAVFLFVYFKFGRGF